MSSQPNKTDIADAIRAAEASYPEPVARVLTDELRVWADFGYRLAVGGAWAKMSALILAIHAHEDEVMQAADARALAADGA
jgi:hypothetical protein